LIELRPYQLKAEQDIRAAFLSGYRAPLFVLPTGGGKTRFFCSIAQSAEKRGRRVLILCHRVELIDQIVQSLADVDVQPDIIAAGYQRSMGRFRAANRTVAVASVQTLVRRFETYPAPTLIIIDEAHHVSAGGTWSEILRHYHTAKNLGVTATPCRLDGRGLGAHFDHMILGPNVRELTEMGYLAPAKVFAPPTVDTSGLKIRMGDYQTGAAEALIDTPAITGDALSHYRKHADGKPALVFCTSVAHAHHVAEQFRKAGVSAIALDGGTDRAIRRMAVADFKEGKIQVMASCDLFSEGFDVPGVHCGIMLRPTASEGLHRQQIGRILRPAPDKPHAIILDHVNNCQKFGLPDEPREWTLDGDANKKPKKSAAAIRVCAKCFAASPARALVCQDCSARFEAKPRQEIDEREGELVELTPEQMAAKRERMKQRQMQGRSRTLEQLIEFGKSKGYAEGWARKIWNARLAKQLQRANG
jgi:superfamily II DNA or RNA helicase